MKDFAMSVNLRNEEEAIKQYEHYHAHPWPEVINSLKQVGILDMKIYRLGRRLFMFMQTEDDFDLDVNLPRYLELDERCREWENLMGTFQEPLPEAGPGEKWLQMKKVFQL